MGRDVCAAVAEEVTVYFLKPNSLVGEEEEDFVSVLRGADDSVNDFAVRVKVLVKAEVARLDVLIGSAWETPARDEKVARLPVSSIFAAFRQDQRPSESVCFAWCTLLLHPAHRQISIGAFLRPVDVSLRLVSSNCLHVSISRRPGVCFRHGRWRPSCSRVRPLSNVTFARLREIVLFSSKMSQTYMGELENACDRV